MSKLFFVLAALSVTATAAFAKLGEDLKQSIVRYGNPVGNDEVLKTVSFSKDGFFIVCHFKDAKNIQDRVCDSMVFTDVEPNVGVVPLTSDQVSALLNANGNGLHWQHDGNPPSPDNFVTDDGSIYAHYDRDGRALVLATKEYKDSQEGAQSAPASTPGM